MTTRPCSTMMLPEETTAGSVGQDLSTKHQICITDCKFDDLGALALLFLTFATQTRADCELLVIITDVQNIDGARGLVQSLFQDLIARHQRCGKSTNVNVRFARGVPSAEEQKHEAGLFSKYEFGDLENKEWVDINSFTGQRYTCYALAPYQEIHHIVKEASCVYVGYGYNTRTVTLDDFKQYKDLHILNNCSGAVYKQGDAASGATRVEGGRFRQSDHELWQALEVVSPVFTWAKQHALADSAKFAAKYTQKAFDTLGIEFKVTVENLLSNQVYAIAKDIQESSLPPYLFRSIDQVKRRVLDIECSDLQHVALWLTRTNLSGVKLVQGANSWLDFVPACNEESNDDGAVATCPTGLHVEDTRNAVLQIVHSLTTGTQAAGKGFYCTSQTCSETGGQATSEALKVNTTLQALEKSM